MIRKPVRRSSPPPLAHPDAVVPHRPARARPVEAAGVAPRGKSGLRAVGGARHRRRGVQDLAAAPQAIMRAREQSRRYAVLTVAQTIVALVLAITLRGRPAPRRARVLLSQLVAEVLICLYLVPEMVRGISLRFSKADAKELLGYGFVLMPGALLSFVIHLADRYFLRIFVSVGAVGIYALGYRIGEILYIALAAFELAYPQFVYGHLKNPDARVHLCPGVHVLPGRHGLHCGLSSPCSPRRPSRSWPIRRITRPTGWSRGSPVRSCSRAWGRSGTSACSCTASPSIAS